MEYGPDNLKEGLFKYCTEEISEFIEETNSIPDKAHNEYIQIAATIGIPGLLIYLGFIYIILKNNLKKIFTTDIYFLIIIAICTYMTQAFFNISTIGIAPLFWMLLGIIDNKKVMEYLEKSMK